MYMKLLERILLRFLLNNKITMEITGFDMDAFAKAIDQELKARLETVECIVFEDSGMISDAQKVASIQNLFRREF